MADQVPVEDRTGYTSALQQDIGGQVGSPSMSRVSRRVRRNTANFQVSNAVPDATNLQ
jgi:hypothetical protein